MKIISSVSMLVLVWGVCLTAIANQPNILLVVVDDMGWTDVRCFGSEIDTPNIDALARSGVKFTDFHVSVSCSPTRSMLMSGTDNHIAGLGNMGEMLAPEQRGKPGYEGYLNDQVISLAEVLRDGGYHTYMAGKWHLGHGEDSIPYARGFERSFSMLFGGASYWSDMFGMLAVHEEVAEYVLDGKWLKELPEDFYATRSFTDFMISSIRENRADGKPFLAYMAFTAPHDPIHVPEPWLSKYRGEYNAGYDVLKEQRAKAARKMGLVSKHSKTPKPHPNLKAWDTLDKQQQAIESRAMEAYAGLVENMDYHLGRIINYLKDIDEYENTIVIFFSDNGSNPWYSEEYPGNLGSEWFAQFDNSLGNIGHPMSHYAYGMGWASAGSGPLDLFKMTVGEGGIRSPLIISGPCGNEAGGQVDSFAYVWDIMPTILDYAGITHPQEYKGKPVERMRGKSLRSVLVDTDKSTYGPEEFIAGELQNGKWIRRGDYKAVSVAAPYGNGKWGLYNLKIDPGETEDLAEKQPEIMSDLKTAWESYSRDVGVILTQ